MLRANIISLHACLLLTLYAPVYRRIQTLLEELQVAMSSLTDAPPANLNCMPIMHGSTRAVVTVLAKEHINTAVYSILHWVVVVLDF